MLLISKINVLIKFILAESFQTNGNIPVPTLNWTKSIWNKTLNYRDNVQALSVITDDEVSFINNTFVCNCKSFPYCYPH